MNSVFADEGLIAILQKIVVVDLTLHIFTNNITPTVNSVYADFTEASYSGYAAFTLTHTDWVSLGVSGHIGALAYPTLTTFNSSGGSEDIYGYYVTDVADTFVFWAGLFDSSPVTVLPADSYSFIPTIGDFSKYF